VLVSQGFAEQIKADGYGENAHQAINRIEEFLA
jgi:methanogenic corrinoid protein MtbC1